MENTGLGIRGIIKRKENGEIVEFTLDSISLVTNPPDPHCRLMSPTTELLERLKRCGNGTRSVDENP